VCAVALGPRGAGTASAARAGTARSATAPPFT